MQIILSDIHSILPELLLCLGLILMIIQGLFRYRNLHAVILAFLIHLSAIALIFLYPSREGSFFYGNILIHENTDFFRIVIISISLLTFVLTSSSREMKGLPVMEINVMITGSTIGSLFIILSSSMPALYLSVEFSSFLTYILAGTGKTKSSKEAGLKYALYGGVSSGIMLYAMSILYGTTGSLSLVTITASLSSNYFMNLIFFAFFLGGIGYKLAAVPFHAWCPDVYEGSPTPVAFYLTVPRIAGFAFLLLFFDNFISSRTGSQSVYRFISFVSILTMTVGNISAVNQESFKRMLAWSSIAHGGYLLSLFSTENNGNAHAIHYYVFAYAVMTGGAFAVYQLLEKEENSVSVFRGLGFRGRTGAFISLLMVSFIFSLIGIPPFSGFFAKYFVFGILIEEKRFGTALVMGFNTVLSVYYYMKVLKAIYFEDHVVSKNIEFSLPVYAVIVLLALLNLAAGIFPDIVFRLI